MRSAGISARSSRERNADLLIRNPRVMPLRDADLLIRHPARALRQSQDADLWIRHLARQERVPKPKVDAKVWLRKPSTPQTQSRRRVEANETVEVDLRMNTWSSRRHCCARPAVTPAVLVQPGRHRLEGRQREQDLLRLRRCQGTRGRLEGHASPSASFSGDVGPAKFAAPLQRLQCTFLFASV